MELGILAGVGAIGYLLSQKQKEQEFKRTNELQLQNYLAQHPHQLAIATQPNVATNLACSDSYPLYNPSYVKHQQRMVSGLNGPKGNEKPQPAPKINRNETLRRQTRKEGFANLVPANDPTSVNLLDMKERPLTDFFHNNMVPFYGAEVRQNMAGTGVKQGNYIDGVDVNTGYDNTTPLQTTFATFTGMDDTYLHKREIGPMFSPAEQQTGWVYGSPNFRPDTDRYTQSLNNFRPDLSPLEPQMVGPGLNIDPSIPASGGFHEFTRILPNNVSDYKANQLRGQVIMGKPFAAQLPTSYPGVGVSQEMNPTQTRAPGVTKNRPEAGWDQVRYPTMTTKVGFVNEFELMRPDYETNFKPNSNLRNSTSYGLGGTNYVNGEPCIDQNVTVGQGPLAAHIPVTGSRSETYMDQDNNIRSHNDCNSLPIGNPAMPGLGSGNMAGNYYVNETGRGMINPINLLPVQAQEKLVSSWQYADDPRTTMKETTEVPYAGNVARGDQGSEFYTYDDEFKTTMKETTQVPYAGNVARGDQGVTFYSYEDDPRTTTKETTEVPYAGNIGRPGSMMMNRAQFEGEEVEVDNISKW